jgi:tetratricopeptide (TPR) repeat protein
MNLDTFLAAAWSEHGENPQQVADQMMSSLHLLTAPTDIVPFARLLTHIYGEHLGQWTMGVKLLNSLRSLRVYDGSVDCDGAITRSVAALLYAGGDNSALALLGDEDQVSALAVAAAALAGRQELTRALQAYSQALELARAGLPPDSPAIRVLAVGGNNLAAALEDKKDRDAEQTQGMIAAAEGALKYWKLAGTWLEEERAEYRLSRSLLQAGRAQAALVPALRCVALCELNQAPAFELFFGYAVLALARRAAGAADLFVLARQQALNAFASVPIEERQWCESDLSELQDQSALPSSR